MSPRRKVALAFGALLVALLTLSWWNPASALSDGLRDNLVSDFFTALITLLFFDQALEAVQRHRDLKQREEHDRAAYSTLDHALHALWSLLVPALERDDPFRRETVEARIERFLHELSDEATWNGAPPGHGGAVRARIRDLGEDAGALGFGSLRAAARAIDDDWPQIPRGQLAPRFASTIAPEVEAVLAQLRARGDD